jgi:glutamate-1-semialdehyde 2,1-aminomutase
MPSLVVSYAHTDEDVDRTIDAIDGALGVYKNALQHGVDKYLVGRASQPVFRRFNSPDTPAPVLKRASNA